MQSNLLQIKPKIRIPHSVISRELPVFAWYPLGDDSTLPITAITIEHSTTDYYLLANFSVLNRGEVQVQIRGQVQGVGSGGPGEFREIREVTFVKDQGQYRIIAG